MELDKKYIEGIIRKIIEEETAGAAGGEKRQIDPSGVIAVNIPSVQVEKFPFPIPSDKVWLKDVLSLEESPRIGCGVMEMDHTTLDWTLTYDEVDYVIEGTLDIIIDGRKVTANAGEMLFIPKNTTITFSTPNKTRFIYVVYPANWSEQ